MKLIAILILTCSLSTPSFAAWTESFDPMVAPKETTEKVSFGNVFSTVRDYGLPCLAAIGVSSVMIKNDGMSIGLAICATSVVSTAVSSNRDKNMRMSTEEETRINKKVLQTVKASQSVLIEQFNKAMSKMSETNDANVNELRKVIREVISERIATANSELIQKMEKLVDNGNFLPNLEAKLHAKLKEDVQADSKSKVKQIVSQCVDQTVDRVEGRWVTRPTKRKVDEQGEDIPIPSEKQEVVRSEEVAKTVISTKPRALEEEKAEEKVDLNRSPDRQ